MTIIDAYKVAKALPDRNFLINCIDAPEYWAFLFHYEVIEPDDYLVGGCYDAVCKKTGDITHVAIPYDMYLLEGGYNIDISMFF